MRRAEVVTPYNYNLNQHQILKTPAAAAAPSLQKRAGTLSFLFTTQIIYYFKSEVKNINKNYKNTIVLEGEISVLSVMNNNPERIRSIILKDGIKYNNASRVLDTAKNKNIKTEFWTTENIEKITNGKNHGGIIAIAAKKDFLSVQELFLLFDNAKDNISIAVLEGIEDPYNLGYAVRALYTQGVDALIIQERDLDFSEPIIEKASTGTFSMMNTAVFGKSDNEKAELSDFLKSNAFTIYCVDKRKDAESIFNINFAKRTAFVIGGEKRGISKIFADKADKFIQIPYNCNDSFAYSLTSQTAATIISYEIHRQFSKNIL